MCKLTCCADGSVLDESVAESTISESTDGNEAAEGTETGEESSEASTVDGETDAEAKDNSLRNYEVLYQDMLEVRSISASDGPCPVRITSSFSGL